MEQGSEFKSLEKSSRKQRIIDVAVKVFHEKGYGSATLDDLAKELGLTKAALYHYVSSKEQLLSTIYIQALESFFESAYEIGEMDLAPPEKMRLLVRNHIKQIIIENLSMFAVFFTEEHQLPEEDFQKIREAKRKYTSVVEGIILTGISQGYFRSADPRLQAYAIIGMCNWIYKWYKPNESSQTPDEISDHFVALLENGFLRHPDQAAHDEVCDSMSRKRVLFDELRTQSKTLTELIEELEKFV